MAARRCVTDYGSLCRTLKNEQNGKFYVMLKQKISSKPQYHQKKKLEKIT
jgi:hypothetical protein